MDTATLRIDRRFRGPPQSGNGGYVAGLLAKELGSSHCAVTLRQPPPLDEPMRLERAESEILLFCGERLIASAAPADLVLDVPAARSLAEAEDAATRFSGFRHHIFPGCFVCGPERVAGDGLRIFPGLAGSSAVPQVTAAWVPDSSLGDGHGMVRPEFLWAALDCPGYFAVEAAAGTAVLGRLTAILHREVVVGEPIIVTGWPVESSGRKHIAGTALHDRQGVLLAVGLATWVSITAPAE